jgi:hypothetical protein
MAFANHLSQQGGKADDLMKLESMLNTVAFLGGTTLPLRMVTHGLELALAVTAMDWLLSRAEKLRQRRKGKR